MFGNVRSDIAGRHIPIVKMPIMISDFYPLDPRVYVREELEARRRRRPHYSMRAFARDLQMSPSSLCEFLASRQGLSRGRALWVAEKLNLSGDQTEHFWDLIQSQFGYSERDKKAAKFRALDRARSSKSQLALEHFRMIADWYHLVLLEILTLPTPPSLMEISALLDVPLVELERAVARLIDLGFLLEQNGKLVVLTDVTTVGEEIDNRAVQISHQQMLRVHADAIDRKPFAERENLTVAFSIRQSRWPELRKEIQRAVMGVLSQFANEDEPKDQTVSMTMQMMTLLPVRESKK